MTEQISQEGVNFSTLVHILKWRAVYEPDRPALIFMRNGIKEEGRLTYKELDQKAREIAFFLSEKCYSGACAVLIFPPGLEFITAFFGCLYSGIIAVPVPPPDPVRFKRTLPRLQAILSDAQPSVILSTSKLFFEETNFATHVPELGEVEFHFIDKVEVNQLSVWEESTVLRDGVAFLQYTSGSTADPKGVMVSHENLMDQFSATSQAGNYNSGSVSFTWMPHFHDYGLIHGILQPIATGCPAYLMSTLAFLKSPMRWLQAISRLGVTHSGGPNFAYELCLRACALGQPDGLNLRHWKVASCGAEPLRPNTLDRFCQTFSSYGFRRQAFFPSYGLAESTLLVSTKPQGEFPAIHNLDKVALEKGEVVQLSSNLEIQRPIVGCGFPVKDTKIMVVHPEERTQVGPNQIGEIWISGPSVAKGYWNRPEESKEVFHAHLQNSGEGPFLRTGDLGYLHNGQVFITGRLKDLIIIHGRNHYPQDLESTMESSSPALRAGSGAAFSIEKNGEERLVVAQELERRNTLGKHGDLFRLIRERIADEHDIHAFAILFLRAGSIPKTSSGKIRREACKSAFLTGALDILEKSVLGVEATDETMDTSSRAMPDSIQTNPNVKELESYICHEISQILDVPTSKYLEVESLRSLGLDSLMALELKNRLEKKLCVPLELKDLLQGPSVIELTKQLLQRHPELSVNTVPMFVTTGRNEKWEEGEV